MQSHNPPHAGIAALLAMTMALGPLALDTYLPAFPDIAEFLSVSVHQVSLTISVYVFVLALGQLTGGPLSDRYGRKRIMLSGLAVFSLASLLILQASSLQEFLLLRALQAFGGGWAAVCVPALVRDRLSGREAARFFSLIGLLMVAAPALAPSIGSLLLTQFGWLSIFLFIGVYAILVLVMQQQVVFRDYQRPRHHEPVSVLSRYKAVINTRPAMRFMAIGTMAFSVMMLFITHASFIYQEHFGVGPGTFALLFGANVVLMLCMNLLNRRLLNRFASERILRWALTAQGVGIVLLLLVLGLTAELLPFVLAMVLTIGMLGAVSPNIQACYMEYFREHGGTAAALMGATQFSVAGLISAASALLPESVTAIVLAQGACSLLCLALIWTHKPAAAQPA
ncbi:multidrug effflux MFS transporter [Thalassolituus sp. LLYu03]|uniref:multidrug effflux MFS transporter n=1 Tax=Thalassolituus sp. LLYu03 TaxID=3421656 RepID=UPI003D2C3DB2